MPSVPTRRGAPTGRGSMNCGSNSHGSTRARNPHRPWQAQQSARRRPLPRLQGRADERFALSTPSVLGYGVGAGQRESRDEAHYSISTTFHPQPPIRSGEVAAASSSKATRVGRSPHFWHRSCTSSSARDWVADFRRDSDASFLRSRYSQVVQVLVILPYSVPQCSRDRRGTSERSQGGAKCRAHPQVRRGATTPFPDCEASGTTDTQPRKSVDASACPRMLSLARRVV